jgi:hypothetical protein
MSGKKSIVIAGVILSVLLIPSVSDVAFAQYIGNVGENGETGKNTLEEALKLQRERVLMANQNPETGSGTPYLDASGVVGASVISAAVFGGVAGLFFIKGRSGKYAAMGRG